MLRAFAAQSILHALIAGILVETLLWAWRVEDGAWRLRFRLVPLAFPLVVLPAFLAVPPRAEPAFAANWAIFVSGRWNLLHVGGAGVGDLVLVCTAGIGAALFLRDALPALLDVLKGPSTVTRVWMPPPPALTALVAETAARLGIRPPAIRMLRSRLPVLFCEQAGSPALVVSAGTLDRLDPAALDAAVAHELAHAAHRDPAWGYALIAARALTFFNPATQWAARAVVDEIERRADQAAARLTGRPDALARAIGVMLLTDAPSPSDVGGRFERLFWQGRALAIRRRCARLLASAGPAPLALPTLRLALVVLGLAVLLFFVV